MLSFQINIKELNKELNKITCWDDWYKVEKEIFRIDEWPEKLIEVIEEEAKRVPQIIEGIEWNPFVDDNDIQPEILYLYEKISLQIFTKLEPTAELDNQKHPERYGKMCIFCKIWSNKYRKERCPKCNHELLPYSIN